MDLFMSKGDRPLLFPPPPPLVTMPLYDDHTWMCRQITNLQTKFIKQNLENAFNIDHELYVILIFTGPQGHFHGDFGFK